MSDNMSDEGQLRQGIGFLGLLALSVGINIGGGLFVLVNIAGGETGPSLPLAMLLSAVPAVLAIVPYRMLARGYPTTSGTYRYTKLLSPAVALMAGLGLLFAVVVGGQPLFSMMTGNYLARLDWVGLSPTVIALATLTVFYVVNLIGVRPTVMVQSVLLFVLIGSLVAFILAGVGQIDGSNFAVPFPGGGVGFVTGAVMLYALMAGGLFIIEVGGEVVEPKKIFSSVLPLGMAIVLALYLGITIVAVGVAHWSGLADDGTLVGVAERFMGTGMLSVFILGGAVVAGVTTINATYTLVSRGMLVVARDGMLPAVLGRVNARFGTPHWALTICWVASMAMILVSPAQAFLGALMNMGLVVAIGVVSFVAARVPERHPDIFAAADVGSPRTLKIVSYTVVGLNAIVVAGLISADIRAAALLSLVYLTGLLVYRVLRPGPAPAEVTAPPAVAD